MEVAKKHQDQLERIKTTVRKAHDYFRPNYDRYNEFKKFIFESSLKEEEITLLMTLSKPQLEFNILEAYISRLLGEFSKQEPDIIVSADDQNTADPITIKFLEQHLRHVLSDEDNHHTRYEVYKDILSGGFSTIKVTTDYANPMSFNQVINIERVFDPTLCGFDQLARYPHKGDGRFCFELYPMEKTKFQELYPVIPINELNFRRDFAGFNWSYLNDATEILILADYYEKKIKKTKIVQLRDGKTITMKQYEKMESQWNDFAQMPTIVGKPRMTEIETVCRYRLIENRVLEYDDTDFTYLPLIFVDGNSAMIKTPKNGNVRQVTRPYVYHAKSAQRLKNFAGISLANEIENLVQHKFIVKKEAIPKEEELLQAYKDIQKQSNIIVNAFYEENPNMPIPDPIREIAKIPTPPEVAQAFTATDSAIQNILGSYDASL
ncbi:MAG TPA: portal protein, partial [Puia sp.]|nr:portal protein [Puia sp.]